jgi:DNA-binding transcriptional regulator GbsR (MarR family)
LQQERLTHRPGEKDVKFTAKKDHMGGRDRHRQKHKKKNIDESERHIYSAREEVLSIQKYKGSMETPNVIYQFL